MSAHSPLPWREYSLRNFTRLLDANGEIVATIRHEKDASMVVKAVNNHEKLVEALEASLAAMDTVRDGWGFNYLDDEDEECIAADLGAIRTAEKKARAAIFALNEQP